LRASLSTDSHKPLTLILSPYFKGRGWPEHRNMRISITVCLRELFFPANEGPGIFLNRACPRPSTRDCFKRAWTCLGIHKFLARPASWKLAGATPRDRYPLALSRRALRLFASSCTPHDGQRTFVSSGTTKPREDRQFCSRLSRAAPFRRRSFEKTATGRPSM